MTHLSRRQKNVLEWRKKLEASGGTPQMETRTVPRKSTTQSDLGGVWEHFGGKRVIRPSGCPKLEEISARNAVKSAV